MTIQKRSEKLLIWMHRNDISGQQIADESGTSRQHVSRMIKNNYFSDTVLAALKRMGFNE